MHVEFIVNGSVVVLLSPENDAEAELLKLLCKQTNEITEVKSTITVLNKTFKSGIVIGKKNTSTTTATDGPTSET